MGNELKLRWSKAPEGIDVRSPLSVHRCPLCGSHCKFSTLAVNHSNYGLGKAIQR